MIWYNIFEVIFNELEFYCYYSKEDDWYVAKCAENNIASQGKTIEEAISNLKEAIELYYEDNEPEFFIAPAFVTTLEVAI